jgi:hypothetical protein
MERVCIFYHGSVQRFLAFLFGGQKPLLQTFWKTIFHVHPKIYLFIPLKKILKIAKHPPCMNPWPLEKISWLQNFKNKFYKRKGNLFSIHSLKND